jgi:hypothetical protein
MSGEIMFGEGYGDGWGPGSELRTVSRADRCWRCRLPTLSVLKVAGTTASASPTPSLAKVPAVKGLSLTKAKRKLRAAGLEVGDLDRRPSNKRKDTVLKQGVHEGTELEPGSSVALVVVAPYPRVPSVVGRQEASAVRKLKNAGFKVKKTTQTRTSGKDGVVLSQSRAGGTRTKPRSVVHVVISNVQRCPDNGGSSNCTPGYTPSALADASGVNVRQESARGICIKRVGQDAAGTGPARDIDPAISSQSRTDPHSWRWQRRHSPPCVACGGKGLNRVILAW